MKIEKITIKNRKDQNIAILVEQTESQKGLAFVMHGLGSTKEVSQVQAMAEIFEENDYTVVRFDATNSYGESDGDYADATVMNYYEDLEDVIKWSQEQPWYEEPFVLAGHSLGGICTVLFAQKYPEKVKALAPISTVVSGKLSYEGKEEELKQWEKTGWKETPSSSIPGLIKRLKYSHVTDRMKYDLLQEADKLTMPILLIVGENDVSTPLRQQEILFKALPEGKKELHIIKGAPHSFRKPEELKELKELFNNWIKSL